MRIGRRVAIDVGKARIGIAISDASGLLASPLATVIREESLAASIRSVLQQLHDFSPLEIYVGIPLKMDGSVSPSTQDAIDFALALSHEVEIAVRGIDERLTTVSAASNLRMQGFSSKSSRPIVDQEAAAIILESALNQERLNGQVPGKSISEFE